MDEIQKLTEQVERIEKTLGTLIAWSLLQLGKQSTETLLNMLEDKNDTPSL